MKIFWYYYHWDELRYEWYELWRVLLWKPTNIARKKFNICRRARKNHFQSHICPFAGKKMSAFINSVYFNFMITLTATNSFNWYDTVEIFINQATKQTIDIAEFMYSFSFCRLIVKRKIRFSSRIGWEFTMIINEWKSLSTSKDWWY